jgi:sulfur-oxidizing protein SoxZ
MDTPERRDPTGSITMGVPFAPQIVLPETVTKGETIEIETLIAHPMETGQRIDTETGNLMARNIIEEFVAHFNGREVFRAKLYPAISANPYIAFQLRVEESGEFEFTWRDANGKAWQVTRAISVS